MEMRKAFSNEANRNYMRLEFLNRSENESFARAAVASFIAPLDPTVEELTEVKTAVSEAVSNAIIYAYEDGADGIITVECTYDGEGKVTVSVEDQGVGIDDIPLAREPLYTSRPGNERSGMGFTVMESFMDRLEVESEPGAGTRVTMSKKMDYVL